MRRLALIVRPHVERHRLALTPLVGLAVAVLAVGYSAITGKAAEEGRPCLNQGLRAMGLIVKICG